MMMHPETRKARPPMESRAQYGAPPAQHQFSTIEQALIAALSARGVASIAIHADGAVHRFDAPDKKRGNLAGWYVCPSPEVAVWGFWHTGEQQVVNLHGEHDPIAAERARQAAEQARRERQQQREREQAKAAQQAREMWANAYAADSRHPYLIAKRVAPHGLRQQGNELLVPLYADNALVNLQRIAHSGEKRFLKRGRIQGAASLVGTLAGARVAYLCEGWATAATIHETTGCPVVAAMNANNLLPVARRIRAALPAEVEIIVAADNDRHTDGNPGYTAARQAADAIRASLTWPTFPCESCRCSDFNDLAQCRGREVAL